MENQSGLKPLGVAVLIEPYEPERKGAVIALPDFVKERSAMLDNRARVIEVGPSAWHDEPHARAVPGDLVLVTKFAGYMAVGPKDKKVYRLVNDRDIFAGITHEEAA